MDSIRKEIEAEIRRSRLDKGRLYNLLLKIIDANGTGTGIPGPQGPQGDKGEKGDKGDKGEKGEKCDCNSLPPRRLPLPRKRSPRLPQEDHQEEDCCGLKPTLPLHLDLIRSQ